MKFTDNNQIAKTIKDDTYGSFFGTNILSFQSDIKYHHWKLQLVAINQKIEEEDQQQDDDDDNDDDIKQEIEEHQKSKLILGIISNDKYENIKDNQFTVYRKGYPYYGYFVDQGYSRTEKNCERWLGHYFEETQRINIIHMYLNLESREVHFIVNDESMYRGITDISTHANIEWLLLISINHYVQIISYNNSCWNEDENEDLNDFQNHLDYARAVDDTKIQIKHFKKAMKLYPNECNIFAEDYVESLLNSGDIEIAHEFILRTRNGGSRNICVIACKLYYKQKYIEAEQLFDLIDDDSLILYNGTFEKARNYHNLKKYELALKYFEITMSNTTSNEQKAYCLSNMALLYDYENTTKETEIHHLDASIRQSEEALKYNPEQPSILINFGYFFLVKKEYDKS